MVPLGPEELDQKELEEKIGEEENAGEIKTAGIKSFVLGNVKEVSKKPKKPKKNPKPMAELKKMLEPVNFLKKDTESWLEPEGQLVIDVYETDDEIVIQSAIAGISPENLDISIEKDMVSIKGKRECTAEKSGKNYLIEECYWGAFSREIILPTEVDSTKAEASMKNGVLTIRAPKIEREKKKLTVK
ncbi:MAG: Hsp20/alpha crystallin family protein [Candidatus Nealsonbacteria bacterium]|nr:Hsp20/alpha crystallin family protein [Candidatus Nealsonbacteria bacterium]